MFVILNLTINIINSKHHDLVSNSCTMYTIFQDSLRTKNKPRYMLLNFRNLLGRVDKRSMPLANLSKKINCIIYLQREFFDAEKLWLNKFLSTFLNSPWFRGETSIMCLIEKSYKKKLIHTMSELTRK